MAETVRAPSMYIKGRKVGECSGGDLSIENGGEIQITDGGPFAISDGAVTCNASFNCVIPVGGMGQDMVRLLVNQTYVKLALPYAGTMITADGKLMSAGLKWDHKGGKLEGDFKFQGLSPKLG